VWTQPGSRCNNLGSWASFSRQHFNKIPFSILCGSFSVIKKNWWVSRETNSIKNFTKPLCLKAKATYFLIPKMVVRKC
jgi:hypothetical protein